MGHMIGEGPFSQHEGHGSSVGVIASSFPKYWQIVSLCFRDCTVSFVMQGIVVYFKMHSQVLNLKRDILEVPQIPPPHSSPVLSYRLAFQHTSVIVFLKV